jgi:hypothetical protein
MEWLAAARWCHWAPVAAGRPSTACRQHPRCRVYQEIKCVFADPVEASPLTGCAAKQTMQTVLFRTFSRVLGGGGIDEVALEVPLGIDPVALLDWLPARSES